MHYATNNVSYIIVMVHPACTHFNSPVGEGGQMIKQIPNRLLIKTRK